jgi:aminodeoxyfutalosine deaminase
MARWVFPVASSPVNHGYVALDRGRIVAIGSVEDLPESIRQHYQPEKNTFITPGLVNTHTHLELTYPQMLPVPEHGDAVDWLLSVVAMQKNAPEELPEKKLLEHDRSKENRCQEGIKALLKTGTTCVNDISSDGASLPLLFHAGLRGCVSLEFFHPGRAHEGLSRLQGIVETFNIRREQFAGYLSQVGLGLSPHSLYNVSPSAWKLVVQSCTPAVVHSHVAELEAEMAYLKGEESRIQTLHQQVLGSRYTPERISSSPLEILSKMELLPNTVSPSMESDAHTSKTSPIPLVLAHAIHTSEKARRLIAHKQIGIAHCPRSNMALHGNTFQWQDWKELWEEGGIFIGLGTDSTLSTPNLDLREDARTAMALHGWSSQQALRHCTWEGASVLGLGNDTGSLEIGKDADIVLWDIPDAADTPEESSSQPEDRVFSPHAHVAAMWILGRRV